MRKAVKWLLDKGGGVIVAEAAKWAWAHPGTGSVMFLALNLFAWATHRWSSITWVDRISLMTVLVTFVVATILGGKVLRDRFHKTAIGPSSGASPHSPQYVPLVQTPESLQEAFQPHKAIPRILEAAAQSPIEVGKWALVIAKVSTLESQGIRPRLIKRRELTWERVWTDPCHIPFRQTDEGEYRPARIVLQLDPLGLESGIKTKEIDLEWNQDSKEIIFSIKAPTAGTHRVNVLLLVQGGERAEVSMETEVVAKVTVLITARPRPRSIELEQEQGREWEPDRDSDYDRGFDR